MKLPTSWREIFVTRVLKKSAIWTRSWRGRLQERLGYCGKRWGSGEQNNKQEGPPYSTEFLKAQRTLLLWDGGLSEGVCLCGLPGPNAEPTVLLRPERMAGTAFTG